MRRLRPIICIPLMFVGLAGCSRFECESQPFGAYVTTTKQAKEILLKEDLFALRSTIDEYTYDQKRAPESLNDLVAAGYLKQIPKDPMTG